MAKFLVLYRAPSSVMDTWMQLPEEERKTDMAKMEGQWNEWMAAHKDSLLESAGSGKTKRVTKSGTEDTRNDIMMYSFVEAESHEAAAQLFEGHPHFEIPEASIEVMPVNPMK
ncbi:MAG TPA: hypothetical protein VF696_02840 [Candidatus Paceibacterota bacterium]|jgi:hypothetical protein